MTIALHETKPGRVLVTGAAGFIGRWAVAALREQGFDVHAVGRPMRPGIENCHQADLLDAQARRVLIRTVKPDYLLHAAWFTGHGRFWTAPQNADWLAASLDLLAEFAASGGQRAVIVGSCAEYDWAGSDTEPWREDRLCQPATLYGRAKHDLMQQAASLAAGHGFSFSWGRVFTPIGLHEEPERLVPSVIRPLLAKQRATTGPGSLIRDFLDVRDAGYAFARLVACNVSGAVNIGSGEGLSIGDIARKIGALTGRPELLGIGERTPRAGDPPSMVADVKRLRNEVGFQPRFTLEETLRDAIDYWQGQSS